MEFLKNTDIWIANWKWALIIATIFLSLALANILKRLLTHFFVSIRQRTSNEFIQDFQNLGIERILSWIFLSLIWVAILDVLDLPNKTDKYFYIAIQVVQTYLLILIAYRLADAAGSYLQRAADKTDTTLDDQLVPLARKSLKILIVILGSLIALQSFGFNVVSLLAGLGLGGLALALAAQDTAANVFGSITIFLDKPFQVGDHIRVIDTEGNVEDIGFRSTTIRTFYNSLVTIPNSVMAKEKIDNLGVRPTKRVKHTLGITYDTSPEKISDFIDNIKFSLHQNPDILKDDIRVFFVNMGDFNLQILVQFTIPADSIQEELEVQQGVLLDLMKIANNLDVSFAFPTQTLHIEPAHAAKTTL